MRKLIQYVNIFTKEGKSILFRNYGTLEVDRDLIQNVITEDSKNDIKCTETKDFKYFYTSINTISIVVCTDLEDDDSTVNSKILSIRTKIIKKYEKILEKGNLTDKRTLFHEFEKELDNLILGAIKISILGFPEAGRTELTKLICGKDVDREYVPTITADIAFYDGDEFERSITLWDFAGQAQFKPLWKSLLKGSDICLLVTDSTFENINATKEIIHDILDKYYGDKFVIGFANYQGKPNRLSPEFCERILSTEDRKIKVHGIDTRYPEYREKIIAIMRDAIQNLSNKYKITVN